MDPSDGTRSAIGRRRSERPPRHTSPVAAGLADSAIDVRPGVRNTKDRRAPVTMNDERMSDHDEETKSRLRWTEARRAGGHAFPAPSRVDSTARAGAWCPPRPRRARRRRHIGGRRGAAGPGRAATAAGGGPTRRRLLVAVVVLVAVAVPGPPRRGRGRRGAGGRRRSAAAARPRRRGRGGAATAGAAATFLGLDGHRRRDAVLAPLPRATTGPVVEEAAAGRRSRSTRGAGRRGASAGRRPRRARP